MPKATVREEAEYRLPAGMLFQGRLDKVTERTNIFTYQPHHAAVKNGRARAGEKGEIVKWIWEFKITDGAYDGETAYGETDPKITTKEDDNARQWSETLLGRELEINEEFDTDQVIGLPCKFTVRHGEPRDKKDGGKFYPCPVDDVFPMDHVDDVWRGGTAVVDQTGPTQESWDQPPF